MSKSGIDQLCREIEEEFRRIQISKANPGNFSVSGWRSDYEPDFAIPKSISVDVFLENSIKIGSVAFFTSDIGIVEKLVRARSNMEFIVGHLVSQYLNPDSRYLGVCTMIDNSDYVQYLFRRQS